MVRENNPATSDRWPLGAGISRATVLLLATTCGAATASLYYAQPLLHTIAGAFSVSEGTAGLLVTITQAACGGGARRRDRRARPRRAGDALLHEVYTLHGQARSRLTTAYMVAYFLGGVVLSATTSALYASGGWYAVCVLGEATAAVGLVTWLVTERALSGRLPIGADSTA